jgi:hypothetical protein
LDIPATMFDCEELGKPVRIGFPRPVVNDSHDFDD